MADAHGEHNDASSHRRLSAQPSSNAHSKWRRPSFITRPKGDAKHPHPPPRATGPVSISASSNTAATTATTTSAGSSASSSAPTPAALQPVPDSKKEIRKLLREREDETATTSASDKDSECSRPMKQLEEQAARRQFKATSAVDLRVASTLVPDSLPVQPIQDIPDAAQFRPKYNLYNPVGPKCYMNHHLIPPHTRVPLNSTFSPSFPPTHTAIGAGAATAVDAGRMPVLNRTPSGSPLPTPTASQTRLGDGFPPKRTRKLSNTAHDNVDMLDGSDPSGMNWHHDSPYDVGGFGGSPPPENQRTRTASNVRPNGQSGRPVNPSPLSQSTSAVHLVEPPHTHPQSCRRTLSKPAAGIRRFFSASSENVTTADAKASSVPVTPLDGQLNTGTPPQRKLSKRGRSIPSAPALVSEHGASLLTVPSTGTDKKEKRSSFMGRIGKKFSVLRKPLNEHHSMTDKQMQPEYRRERRPSISESIKDGTVSVSLPRKLSKRTPPSAQERKDQIAHRTSASIDIPYPLTIGNLKIANPDLPGSETASPVNPISTNGLAPSPHSTVAPLPPPKESAPLVRNDRMEDEDRRNKSATHVRTSPDKDGPVVQDPREPHSTSQPSRPPARSQPVHVPVFASPQPDPSLSPLLPPPPLTHHNIPSIPSFFSPQAVSISLSTADLNSPPPPPPEKIFVDPATLTDSPKASEVDYDHLPDIATEPDYDRRAETPTSSPPIPPIPASPPSALAPAPSSSAAAAPRQPSSLRTSVVPFLSADEPQPSEPSGMPRAQKDKGKTAEPDDYSPLSRASLYVNPPTPMANPSTIPFVAPPPPVGARGIPVSQLAAQEAAEERERERQKEREKERERERERDQEREREREKGRERERGKEREAARERERERKREREKEKEKERLREQREKGAAKEREREGEREKEIERERLREEKEREGVKEREREQEKQRDREKEKEKAARSTRRESRRESRQEEREIEKDQSSRHDDRPRAEARTSRYDEPGRSDKTLSRYEDKSRHEDRDRSVRHSKRDSVDKGHDRDRSSRRERKDRSSTTETFRLVRTHSEYMRDVQGMTAAIPVGEEQWTLIEATSKSDKDRSSRRDKERDGERERDRDKEKERSSRRRDSKRDELYESGHASSRHHRHSSSLNDDRRRASTSNARLPVDNGLRHQRSQSFDERRLNGDSHTSGRDKRREKDRRSSRRRDSKQVNGNGHSSDSSHAGEASGNVNSVRRQESLRRAVSDVPAGAEHMMSITASEAWAKDRIWKGKSMLDPDVRASTIHGAGSSYDPRHSAYSGNGVVPGAAYMIQSPYYDPSHAALVHQGSFYAIPVSIRQHASPHNSQFYSPGRFEYPNIYRASYPETLDMSSPPVPAANPLPDPPRQSTYSPEPLVLDPARADDPTLTPEYWSSYAGITTY